MDTEMTVEEICVPQEMHEAVAMANEIEVSDAESEAIASELFAKCDSVIKDVNERRKAKTDPLNAVIKDYISQAKEILKPFEEAKELIGKKMGAYRDSEAVRLADAERRLLEERERHALMSGDAELAVRLDGERLAASAEVPKTVETEAGRVHFREDVVIDSIDLSALPERYIVRSADESLIRRDLKSGNVGGVPGVVWHYVKRPVNVKMRG